MSEAYKTTFTAQRKARRFALQGIYSWELTKNPVHEIEAHTRSENAMHTVHLGLYHELLTGVVHEAAELDALIEEAAKRPLNLISTVELCVLRLAAFELKHRIEAPYKVVIDEALKLNDHFGAPEGYKLINAVLDTLAQTLRSAEVAHHNSSS